MLDQYLRLLYMVTSPRGAVGGCSTPGSRVDPWWNPGSYCPSVSSPGPPRIDEGPQQLDNEDLNFCALAQNNNNNANYNNNRHNSIANQYHQRQYARNSDNSCYRNSNNTSSATSLGYVDSSRSNVVIGSEATSDPYGLITSSLQQQQGSASLPPQLQQQQLAAGSSPVTTDSNGSLARVDSSQNQRQLPSLLSPASSSTTIPASPDSLNGIQYSFNNRIKQEESNSDDRATSSTNFGPSLLSSLLSTSRISNKNNYGRRDNSSNNNKSSNGPDPTSNENGDSTSSLLLGSVKLEYPDGSTSSNPREDEQHVKVEYALSDSPTTELLLKQRATPTNITAIDMKYETQTGPPTTPSHLTSSGVEPPHSSQGNQGIVVGGSPGEVVGVDSMLLSPWGATGTEFLEAHDAKQTAAGLEDAWDTLLLGSSVGVTTAQSLAELKPLPPFTGYTGHLSINGIPGHHYHTIASSAQRPTMQSTSPSPSSTQEYYESSVVSSGTPCPQAPQKHHHHQQHQPPQQQQLPQSTQQTVDYINNIEDLAEIIGSAMADTTVPGSGNGPPGNNAGNNGPTSEHDPSEVSPRDWIDIAEWIDTACSPKTQETTSSSPYSQIYANAATTTPSNPPPQQQHGSTLQSLLTHGYSPMLQQRLQASCGETPSSTSPYPPVSPPGRVSTSCSPDHQLHSSSFVTPQLPRKRSRPSGGGSHNPSKKSPGSTTTTTTLPYGTESGLIGGKEKPVHRCSICNRGFLNKSNIKVHLRTHTGEKPFRCEVCGKPFRQKAHLIKHQQIHKRIGRD